MKYYMVLINQTCSALFKKFLWFFLLLGSFYQSAKSYNPLNLQNPMGFWPVVLDMIRNIDIAVIVGDARMPELSINKELIRKVEMLNVPYIIAYNKIDLVSEKGLNELKRIYPENCFVSGTKNIAIRVLRKKIQILTKKMKLKEPRIGVVGYPNIGKSAIINALARRRETMISPIPGTTRGVQWIRAGGLRILDSPGVIPYEDKNKKLVLIGAKSVEKVKNAELHALNIINMFLIKDKERLKEFYKLGQLSNEPYEILLQIGKKRNFLKKKGEIDEDRTARTIIREWQKGKLRI